MRTRRRRRPSRRRKAQGGCIDRLPAPSGADRKDRTIPLVDNRTEQLINVLAHCVAKREACANDCASQGNADLAGCITLCLDCATLCQAFIPLLARGSQCAEAGRKTAEACRQIAGPAT